MPTARPAKKRSTGPTTFRPRTRTRPTIPLTMRAAAIDRYGGADVVHIREMLVPRPGAYDVLIRVDTAGVGEWDAESRAGDIPSEHGFPLVLGVDAVGVVVAVGARVARFTRGDRVQAYAFGNPHGGFYAEYAAVPSKHVGHLPGVLDFEHGGALTVIGLTALQGVDDALKLRHGESVIVHGASGSVGMIAAQFAAWRGARVLATASGADGVAFVRALGIDDVIDGKTDDIEAAAHRFAPAGLDAVLAFVGGESLTRCIDSLKSGGRVAHPNGVEPSPRKGKRVSVRSYDATSSPERFVRFNRAIVASKLQVPIAATFPLARAAEALQFVETGHVLGKVVLRVRE